MVKARTQAPAERGGAPLRLLSVQDVRRMNMPGAADDVAPPEAEAEDLRSVDVRTLTGGCAALGGPTPTPTATTQYPIAIMCTGLRRFLDYNETISACSAARARKDSA